MASAYTKDFLVEAFMHRYREIETKGLREMANAHYDTVGKDKFRVSASIDAEALKKYRLELHPKV